MKMPLVDEIARPGYAVIGDAALKPNASGDSIEISERIEAEIGGADIDIIEVE